MLTVIVALVGSGKSSTLRPFESRYSVIPSTEVTLSGLPGAGEAAAVFFAGEAAFALAGAFAAGGAAAWGAAISAAWVIMARSRESPLRRIERMGVLQASSGL